MGKKKVWSLIIRIINGYCAVSCHGLWALEIRDSRKNYQNGKSIVATQHPCVGDSFTHGVVKQQYLQKYQVYYTNPKTYANGKAKYQ